MARYSVLIFVLILGSCWLPAAETSTNTPLWLSHPLSLAEAMDVALQNNANVLRGKSDIEAAYGVVVQTRAVGLPRVRSTGNFTKTDRGFIETFPSSGFFQVPQPDKTWGVNLQVIQSIYE